MNFLQKIKSAFAPKPTIITNRWTEQELLLFQNNLQQVIAWTQQLAAGFDFENGKYGKVFRQTNPLENNIPLYKFGPQSTYHPQSVYNDKEEYVSWTNDGYTFERYDFLLQEAIKPRGTGEQFDWSRLQDYGRIVSFQTCVTTHDGAPAVAGNNFVDEADVPPIDTWFYLKRNYLHGNFPCDQALFCWIPRNFEQVMQHTIEVEILGSYQWLDRNDPELYERIINARRPRGGRTVNCVMHVTGFAGVRALIIMQPAEFKSAGTLNDNNFTTATKKNTVT